MTKPTDIASETIRRLVEGQPITFRQAARRAIVEAIYFDRPKLDQVARQRGMWLLVKWSGRN